MTTTKRKIVGLAGFKRTGKDTAARYLESHHGLRSFAFADPVKETAMTMFGITSAQAFGCHGYDREQIVEPWGISVREMLQKVGTECARNVFGYDFWITRLQVRINNSTGTTEDFLVSDVRFENESDWIKSQGGIVINFQRPGCVSDGHASEKGVQGAQFEILNNGSLAELYEKLDQIMGMAYG